MPPSARHDARESISVSGQSKSRSTGTGAGTGAGRCGGYGGSHCGGGCGRSHCGGGSRCGGSSIVDPNFVVIHGFLRTFTGEGCLVRMRSAGKRLRRFVLAEAAPLAACTALAPFVLLRVTEVLVIACRHEALLDALDALGLSNGVFKVGVGRLCLLRGRGAVSIKVLNVLCSDLNFGPTLLTLSFEEADSERARFGSRTLYMSWPPGHLVGLCPDHSSPSLVRRCTSVRRSGVPPIWPAWPRGFKGSLRRGRRAALKSGGRCRSTGWRRARGARTRPRARVVDWAA